MNTQTVEGNVTAKYTIDKPTYSLRLGLLPAPADLIPSTPTSITLALTSFFSGGMGSISLGSNLTTAIIWGIIAALVAALIRQIDTRQDRKGCIFKEGGIKIIDDWEDGSTTRRSHIDGELTNIYRKATTNDDVFVEKRQSEQYNIHVVYSDDPDLINKSTKKVAIQLGTNPKQLLFYPVWGKGCSAVLVHRPEQEWEKNPVLFDESAIVKNRMILQAGRDIKGKTMTYNREIYPHALIAGETGAGKTEAMVADMHAAKATGLNPIIYIIDPKNTPALKRLRNTTYTNNAQEANALLKTIVTTCEERIDRYSDADCDNYWQYRKTTSPQERPICLYIDEVAELVSPDVAEDKKTAKAQADKAKAIITRLVQKYRSAGLMVTLGMQHPAAEVLTTNIRNNLGIRMVLSVADHVAAGVAGTPGAENLPMQGGMILKQGKKTTYGRGVYIASNNN